MLSAIRTYNNPGTIFRSETFIVLAVIAWTYLLHWHYKRVGVDYRCQKKDGTLLTTRHGAVKHWELETCLDSVRCPLEGAVRDNLRIPHRNPARNRAPDDRAHGRRDKRQNPSLLLELQQRAEDAGLEPLRSRPRDVP